ncbi:secreted antigen 1 [Babesia caballi]|uniref:Secreted antigen 1 n=1 Tax=Babesia caballi TaxID=5871 RepID=A0AAV4LMV2_BABCB|nr:secreted antigen 1 [Babesia caballi]
MSEYCEDIQAPQTLKEALEFLAALNDNSKLKKQVEEQLKEKAEMYFKTFDQYTNGVATNLQNVLDNVSTLQKLILDRKTEQYGEYAALKSHFDTCKNDCIDKLLSFLPKLHATLYYLLFNVDSTFESYGGGKWADVACNAGYLKQWLQGSTGTASASRSEDRLFPGGYFKSQLRSTTGRYLAESLRSLVNNTTGGHLQNLLLPLLFIFDPWYYYNTSPVLAFVKAFCEAVNEGKLKSHETDYPRLTSACAALSETLKGVTVNSNSSGRLLVALYNGCVERYKTALKEECFATYVSQLSERLGRIYTFLQNMQTVCRGWMTASLHQGRVSGPFPYGFMFGETWKNGNWDTPKPELQNAIKKLWDKGSGGEGSFPDLIEALSSSSGVSGSRSRSISNPGSSEPGSDGPRKPGSSGTHSASNLTAGSSVAAAPAHTSTNSEATASAASGGGDIAANSVGQTGQKGDEGPRGAAHASSGETASDSSTITMGSAAGGVAVLGGGGAALYFLNVGGIKTLITGVPWYG